MLDKKLNTTHSSIIRNLIIISPKVFTDFRGEFVETFNTRDYIFTDGNGTQIKFVEDDISISNQHVLHGLHGDDKTWKLIQCIYGEVFFAVADMRKDSDSYLRSETFILSDKNRTQILVPAGCVNGNLCLSEKSIFSYKQSQLYSPDKKQLSIRWNDPVLNIDWPIQNPVLSLRDSTSDFIKV